MSSIITVLPFIALVALAIAAAKLLPRRDHLPVELEKRRPS